MKSKYFKNIEEFHDWFKRYSTFENMLHGVCKNEEDYLKDLIEDGYTDLDNLILDGHGYQIGDHTNNGWIYEDEADMYYIKATNAKVEVRKREHKH